MPHGFLLGGAWPASSTRGTRKSSPLDCWVSWLAQVAPQVLSDLLQLRDAREWTSERTLAPLSSTRLSCFVAFIGPFSWFSTIKGSEKHEAVVCVVPQQLHPRVRGWGSSRLKNVFRTQTRVQRATPTTLQPQIYFGSFVKLNEFLEVLKQNGLFQLLLKWILEEEMPFLIPGEDVPKRTNKLEKKENILTKSISSLPKK